jgi:hypothetical protein
LYCTGSALIRTYIQANADNRYSCYGHHTRAFDIPNYAVRCSSPAAI